MPSKKRLTVILVLIWVAFFLGISILKGPEILSTPILSIPSISNGSLKIVVTQEAKNRKTDHDNGENGQKGLGLDVHFWSSREIRILFRIV